MSSLFKDINIQNNLADAECHEESKEPMKLNLRNNNLDLSSSSDSSSSLSSHKSWTALQKENRIQDKLRRNELKKKQNADRKKLDIAQRSNQSN